MKIYWATPGFDDWPLERWHEVLKNLSASGFAGIEPIIAGQYKLGAARIVELLLERARIANGYNMEIDLEAVNRFEVNHHNTANQVQDFITDIGASNIRLLV